MVTNTRRFLRDFAAFKARARKGETVRVQDKEGEFLFAAAAPGLALPHADQFDRIITATAKVHRLALITKDANITDSALVEVVW